MKTAVFGKWRGKAVFGTIVRCKIGSKKPPVLSFDCLGNRMQRDEANSRPRRRTASDGRQMSLIDLQSMLSDPAPFLEAGSFHLSVKRLGGRRICSVRAAALRRCGLWAADHNPRWRDEGRIGRGLCGRRPCFRRHHQGPAISRSAGRHLPADGRALPLQPVS